MSQISYYWSFMYILVKRKGGALGGGALSNRGFFSGVVAGVAAAPYLIARAVRDGCAPVFHTGGQGSIPCARISRRASRHPSVFSGCLRWMDELCSTMTAGRYQVARQGGAYG